jgi:CRISPR-associated protein Cas2
VNSGNREGSWRAQHFSRHTRAQVAAYLQQWGDRIQRIVFACAITSDELDTVRSTLATMINLNTDDVHVLPACATCWSRLTVHGQAERYPDQPYWTIL